MLPVVDEGGKVLGKATRGFLHGGSKILHPVVHLHVFNSKGEMYLQKRPEWKDIQPGKWDTAVGGHVDYGETVEEALLREAREELGLTELNAPVKLMTYVFESDVERELVNVFCVRDLDEVSPSVELDGGRFWHLEEIQSSIGHGILTPNFEQEFCRLQAIGALSPRGSVR